ncbi:hypothetical protein [Methanococcus aeolicus]|uniref:hypothetical protein n=1 Tax=Methanococcus aeolicus TaxID=42879 RepID=UPI0021C6A3AB|nr:hypothetical protein [Methanococcus aeolicus]UXM84350.1 hypothetical protein N6C89_06260 [Methanococcus aeolicus]
MNIQLKLKTLYCIGAIQFMLFLLAIYTGRYLVGACIFPYYPVFVISKLKKRQKLKILKN